MSGGGAGADSAAGAGGGTAPQGAGIYHQPERRPAADAQPVQGQAGGAGLHPDLLFALPADSRVSRQRPERIRPARLAGGGMRDRERIATGGAGVPQELRSEEHTSELQSPTY